MKVKRYFLVSEELGRAAEIELNEEEGRCISEGWQIGGPDMDERITENIRVLAHEYLNSLNEEDRVIANKAIYCYVSRMTS